MTSEHPLNSLQSIPEPPKTISEAARQEWMALIEPVVHVERTRPVDLRSFELLCEILADIRGLEAAIRKEGYSVESSGGLKPHPGLRGLENARRQTVSLLAKFGILPDGSKVWNRH
jgi:phage terminase small subunit